MLTLLKVFARGIITTLLLPFIVLIWLAYGVYCLVVFVVMFFKGVIDYFRGKDFGGELIEDLEARRIVLEKEKADEQAKDMLNIMYQNAMAQAKLDHPEPAHNNPVPPVQQYGPEVFSSPQEDSVEENSIEENNDEENGAEEQ